MQTPTLTSNPMALRKALIRIAAREKADAQRMARPGWFTRLFRPAKARAQTPRTCRLAPTETIHSNF